MFQNHLYKMIIDHVTYHCYENCLNYFSPQASILDVGIGNGIMIRKYHSTIRTKGLKITGIDINRHYLNHCSALIRYYHLEDQISIHHDAVELFQPPASQCYDFILFSMSFMLFENQQTVLDRCRNWLKPEGQIVFFQTMFKERFRLMEIIKPKLKYFTTIDFGKVTYENDFFNLLQENQFRVLDDTVIKKEWFKGEYRMIAASPRNGNGFSSSIH